MLSTLVLLLVAVSIATAALILRQLYCVNLCMRVCGPSLVSSPDPDSQQLRVDYITATWKVGLGNKNDALVPSVPNIGTDV